MNNKRYFAEFGVDSLESKTSTFIAEGKTHFFPLPCGWGLRGWVDSQNNNIATFSNNDYTHPLTPSAREGETFANPTKAHKIQRAGFTMIELVFVIVITGLVAVAGGKAIVQILQNYTLQKMYAKTEMDSASVIRQISNYLQNSIWDSIAIGGTKSISEISNHTDGALGGSNMLYFIEKDLTSLNGGYRDGNMIPYFAGFVDLENSSGVTITTSRRDTDSLSAAVVNRAGLALYFPFINVGTSDTSNKYYQSNTSDNQAIFPIANATATQFTLESTPRQIGDIAMLVNANPSYIRLVDAIGTNVDGKTYEKGDLLIRRREPGDAWKTTVIAKKISNIHFWTESSSSLIRIRVCYEAGAVKSIMEEFCKEGIIMQ